LEPAVWGKPVLFGPHTDHCAEVAALLVNAQGGQVVQDEQDLAQGLRELLRDPAIQQRMGAAAQRVVADNQGALQRSADIIATFLRGREPSKHAPVQQGHEVSGRQS
jgi:3-deoxy-D-manno-octulosonic-acid transferase